MEEEEEEEEPSPPPPPRPRPLPPQRAPRAEGKTYAAPKERATSPAKQPVVPIPTPSQLKDEDEVEEINLPLQPLPKRRVVGQGQEATSNGLKPGRSGRSPKTSAEQGASRPFKAPAPAIPAAQLSDAIRGKPTSIVRPGCGLVFSLAPLGAEA